jgi:hypothetical protein
MKTQKTPRHPISAFSFFLIIYLSVLVKIDDEPFDGRSTSFL